MRRPFFSANPAVFSSYMGPLSPKKDGADPAPPTNISPLPRPSNSWPKIQKTPRQQRRPVALCRPGIHRAPRRRASLPRPVRLAVLLLHHHDLLLLLAAAVVLLPLATAVVVVVLPLAAAIVLLPPASSVVIVAPPRPATAPRRTMLDRASRGWGSGAVFFICTIFFIFTI